MISCAMEDMLVSSIRTALSNNSQPNQAKITWRRMSHTLWFQLSNHLRLKKKGGTFNPLRQQSAAPPRHLQPAARLAAASPQLPLTPPVIQPSISPSALPSPASTPGFLCSRRRCWSCTRGVRRITRMAAPAARKPFSPAPRFLMFASLIRADLPRPRLVFAVLAQL
jgi:hypothetical protein